MSFRHASRTTLAAAAALLAGALAVPPACAGSLTVHDVDGAQWIVTEDPADDAEGYIVRHVGADHKPDLRFGRGGSTPFSLGPDNDTPTSARVDSMGRVWAVGPTTPGSTPQPVVARFGADGNVDARWGVQGKLQTAPIGTPVRPTDLLPLADGSVLIAGETPQQGGAKAVVYHLKADGSLDTGFGGGGIWQRPGTEGASASSLAVGADGTIAVAVSVRGPKPGLEIWVLNDNPPALISREIADDSTDEDDLRLEYAGNRWLVSDSGGPTAVVPAVMLVRHAPTAPVIASTPSDSGQGGFNPFGADTAASAAPAPPAESDDGVPWTWIGVAAALALGVIGILFARGRGASAPPARPKARR